MFGAILVATLIGITLAIVIRNEHRHDAARRALASSREVDAYRTALCRLRCLPGNGDWVSTEGPSPRFRVQKHWRIIREWLPVCVATQLVYDRWTGRRYPCVDEAAQQALLQYLVS